MRFYDGIKGQITEMKGVVREKKSAPLLFKKIKDTEN